MKYRIVKVGIENSKFKIQFKYEGNISIWASYSKIPRTNTSFWNIDMNKDFIVYFEKKDEAINKLNDLIIEEECRQLELAEEVVKEVEI